MHIYASGYRVAFYKPLSRMLAINISRCFYPAVLVENRIFVVLRFIFQFLSSGLWNCTQITRLSTRNSRGWIFTKLFLSEKIYRASSLLRMPKYSDILNYHQRGFEISSRRIFLNTNLRLKETSCRVKFIQLKEIAILYLMIICGETIRKTVVLTYANRTITGRTTDNVSARPNQAASAKKSRQPRLTRFNKD